MRLLKNIHQEKRTYAGVKQIRINIVQARTDKIRVDGAAIIIRTIVVGLADARE